VPRIPFRDPTVFSTSLPPPPLPTHPTRHSVSARTEPRLRRAEKVSYGWQNFFMGMLIASASRSQVHRGLIKPLR